MRIVFFGKGKRGLVCLQKLQQEKKMSCLSFVSIVTLPSLIREICQGIKNRNLFPADPNEASAINKLESVDADLFILAGYGMILGKRCISIPKMHCINLHGGKLPEYRGSSPMNWAL